VGGSVAIDVTAVDDIGVDKVRFLVDGNLINELFTPPFHTIWNTQALTDNTTHIIRIEALDVAQNLGSQQITVTVQNGVQAPPATPR
ncbi:MAG TPA: Ig-like domain-containing protein, partial [Gemmatimonadales bacterium]|nr:Ig-like domain-containing protein [Gemmatimonadales bacterium]